MSYKNYKNNYSNYAKSSDLFKRAKQTRSTNQISQEKRERMIEWTTFYRRNIHRFIEHYFGIHLHPYQIIWIYAMSISDSYVAICSRAVGKSWLLGVYAMARAVLYPGSKVVVVSSTKEQAGIIIDDKIKELQDNYPNVAREIRNLTSNMNTKQVDLHNGSRIVIVAARDSSRGKRSTFTIYEEFRLIDKSVVDAVIRPFSYIRQAPYLKNPKYQHLVEESKEAFISSAWHKGEWWYEETKENIKNMLKGKNAGFIAIDYLAAIRHRIKTAKQIESEKSKMDEVTALMEYDNIPWGESADAYFKLKMFTNVRKIKRAFYPQRILTYNPRKNPYQIERKEGEIRLITCDIAQMAGQANDLSITGCIRLLPTHKGYFRELVYMESYSGVNSIRQALRIKQIFYDFGADHLVLDFLNSGVTLYDQLGIITKDEERGIEYDPWTVMQHPSIENSKYDELSERTTGLNALPIVYPISATSRLNAEIAVAMRDILQKKMFGLLVDESEAEDYMIRSSYKKEFLDQGDLSANSFFIAPYLQTSLFINECINLSLTLLSGNVRLVEPSGSRKDRYSSIAYGNYFATLLDQELIREPDQSDMLQQMMALTQTA